MSGIANPPRAAPAGLRPRSQPAQARAQLSRRRVLDAAHVLLKAHGVDQLTTAAIAEASGLSVGAVYRFFPNKEAIICQLYEEKLAEIRRLSIENREGDPSTTPWRTFFRSYFQALKAAEYQVDFDCSLADAIHTQSVLWPLDLRHAVSISDQLVLDMKGSGASWSDEALFDLAMSLYNLDYAFWMTWRQAQRRPAPVIPRLIEAALSMLRPAMEGESEPAELAVLRRDLLKRLD